MYVCMYVRTYVRTYIYIYIYIQYIELYTYINLSHRLYMCVIKNSSHLFLGVRAATGTLALLILGSGTRPCEIFRGPKSRRWKPGVAGTGPGEVTASFFFGIPQPAAPPKTPRSFQILENTRATLATPSPRIAICPQTPIRQNRSNKFGRRYEERSFPASSRALASSAPCLSWGAWLFPTSWVGCFQPVLSKWAFETGSQLLNQIGVALLGCF